MLRVAVDFQRPGYLLVNDLYDPGWQAQDAEGRSLPLLRANRLFRAVALPAGRKLILMAYKPLSLKALSHSLQTILTK
jgi:uncharacterized membrane protein YfhO